MISEILHTFIFRSKEVKTRKVNTIKREMQHEKSKRNPVNGSEISSQMDVSGGLYAIYL